jgi:DoxX-like family
MPRNSKNTNRLLWAVQILLALLFGFAGGMKLVLPAPALQHGPISLPVVFLRFIGIAELLGGLGLVLPGLFRIGRGLTTLAALGLVIIMVGATVLTAFSIGFPAAPFPFVVGALALTVCVGRGGLAMRLGHGAATPAPLFHH